jgi:negative regulator of sigma E activity
VTASVVGESRLGRDVEVVTVEEGDVIRARIWFDNETGAALGSEVYDSAGELFRLSWMLDFDPNPRKIFTMMRESGSSYDVVVPADAGSLADGVAGYVRVDAYAGPDDSLHAFYTDGLFSFSVFVIEGDAAWGPFADAETMRVDGAAYRWLLTPSDLWVQWDGGGFTYVLVGDLPPDHLEQVLREMPKPSQGNIFSRLWRGIFG